MQIMHIMGLADLALFEQEMSKMDRKHGFMIRNLVYYILMLVSLDMTNNNMYQFHNYI